MITELNHWATRHRIPPTALNDLLAVILPQTDHTIDAKPGSEAAVLNLTRLHVSSIGGRIWRNNVGAGKIEGSGSYIRWGLCNDTPKLNAAVKSSDLVGILPITIRSEHVGTRIGQFIARETKHPTWKYTGTDREQAQLKFITLVNALGGDAKFTTTGR